MPTILIVDDDSAMREALDEAARDLGYDTRLASSGASALAALDEGSIDAVLLDLRMPGLDGLETLRRMRARRHPPQVTVLTAYASAQNTIEAMRLGAFDHLTKPIARSQLKLVLRAMVEAKEASQATPPVEAEPDGLIGSGQAMRDIQKAIGMLADSEATTLITGETGTGKELVARAIHAHGLRRDKPFVAVNCAAIPAELMESELFGHKRGAFTGAIADRVGAFRDATGGTLFLDEIGDMDIALQSKILRALQEREVTPVGGGRPRSTCGSSLRPIAIFGRWCATGVFAKICSIGFTSCRLNSRRCASDWPISSHWPKASSVAPGSGSRLTPPPDC